MPGEGLDCSAGSAGSASRERRFVVGEAEAGHRLDVTLASLAGVPRAQARRWLEEGLATLVPADARGARRARPAARVQVGDVLAATPPEPIPSTLEPEARALAVLFEDRHLIVIDKPAGMVVHPGPGHATGTLVQALLAHCGDLAGIGGVLRPGIVHRLDRGTSGAMVAAKHDAAHLALARQFRDHSIERVYHALVRGVPRADTGSIERRVGRHPRDRKRMSVRSDAGREARTRWRVQRRFASSGYSWLELRPETGRTHQLRVHLAASGLPIAGDPVYGRRASASREALGLERPALHASLLGFEHPVEGGRMRFEAPLPPDLVRVLAALEAREGSGGG